MMKIIYKKGMVSMTIGALMILSAVGLSSYNAYTDFRAGKVSGDVLDRFSEISSANETDYNDKVDEVPYYVLNPDIEMPETDIDGNKYIGVIEIPEIELRLSVMSNLSDAGLKIAPCRYKGSVYKNNMIIAGHNYRTHFSKIKNLPVGSSVRFYDADGNIFYYTVSDIELIDGGSADEMESGEWDLTLFTCNYGGKSRVTIRCSLAAFGHNEPHL